MPGGIAQEHNSVISSEWKENFRLSQPNPSPFWRHFVFRGRGNKQLVHHSIMNFPGVGVVCKRRESEYPFSANAYGSKYSKIDESGNIYEFGKKISFSVNLVLVTEHLTGYDKKHGLGR